MMHRCDTAQCQKRRAAIAAAAVQRRMEQRGLRIRVSAAVLAHDVELQRLELDVGDAAEVGVAGDELAVEHLRSRAETLCDACLCYVRCAMQ